MVYAVIGDTAAPGGQLFQLVVLTVAAHFGGWLMSLTTLPRLIGMLLVGILFQVRWRGRRRDEHINWILIT